MQILHLVLAVLVLRSNSCCANYNLAGPYECTIEDMTDCKNVGSGLVQHHLKVRKVNATTRLLQGGTDFKIPLDENMSYELNAAKWGAGGWGRNAYKMKGDDFCSMFHDTTFELFESYSKALGAAQQCPIPAGTYDIESGMELTFKNFKKFPSLPYGRYLAELKLFMGEELVGCIEITTSIDEVPNNN
ncbi:uncharacterized protein [Anabrus simplex]|uniref:uncharacterized protein isoform X2 n=1 Tax=Anabrus simplex TaxID=316456 RepID=UPI0035A3CD62